MAIQQLDNYTVYSEWTNCLYVVMAHGCNTPTTLYTQNQIGTLCNGISADLAITITHPTCGTLGQHKHHDNECIFN